MKTTTRLSEKSMDAFSLNLDLSELVRLLEMGGRDEAIIEQMKSVVVRQEEVLREIDGLAEEMREAARKAAPDTLVA